MFWEGIEDYGEREEGGGRGGGVKRWLSDLDLIGSEGAVWGANFSSPRSARSYPYQSCAFVCISLPISKCKLGLLFVVKDRGWLEQEEGIIDD
jgi:hypothetical protein